MIAPAIAGRQNRTAPLKASTVAVPRSYNYIGAFLTFRCPYRCPYCINHFDAQANLARVETSGIEWIRFFERLDNPGLPVTLQGGEPGLHPDFLIMLDEILRTHAVDILTNLAFDLPQFCRKISPGRINRTAPYAPIRASYHPSQFPLAEITGKILFLQNEGYRIGLYAVEHPDNTRAILHASKVCADLGIDFRTKPFLGRYNDRLYGEFAYPGACSMEQMLQCECATSELLIAPDGRIYPCHHHLYSQTDHLGNISNNRVILSDAYRPCRSFGHCNPCDVKIKNNRFQNFGHTSMKIRFPQHQHVMA